MIGVTEALGCLCRVLVGLAFLAGFIYGIYEAVRMLFF